MLKRVTPTRNNPSPAAGRIVSLTPLNWSVSIVTTSTNAARTVRIALPDTVGHGAHHGPLSLRRSGAGSRRHL